MTVRMVGEKLAREAGRRSASVEVDERKLAAAGAAAAIQAVRKQAASMSDVLHYFWKVHILEQPEAWFKDMGGCVKRCILVVEIKRR